MNTPKNLLYTESHEWVAIEGNLATIGITDFAQSELSDIIYVEFPEVGVEATKGEPFGVIEAVKTVADLFSPLSGKIIAINESLNDFPERINKDPYGEGWIIKIELKNPSEKETLLSATRYEELVS